MSMMQPKQMPDINGVLSLLERTIPDIAPELSHIRDAAEQMWATGVRPIRAMIDSGIQISDIEHAIWSSRGFEYIAELPALVSADLVERIPPLEALDLGAFAIGRKDSMVIVAVLDPQDTDTLNEIRSRFLDEQVKFVVTNRPAVESAAERHEDNDLNDELDDEDALTRAKQLQVVESQLAGENRIGELIDVIIERAVLSGASDVHIEPDNDHCQVRFRLDGILTLAGSYPASFGQIFVNRVKILSQLDVGDRRTPQDGRASAVFGGRAVDMRVVTLPSAWGNESCVIRLLDQTRVSSRLAELGFSRAVRERFEGLLTLQGGVVLATGPTGSGKTTTLYNALKRLTTPEVKTVTVEDPVEYRLSGMLQIQVNRDANFYFEDALRAVLRADPDVLLVGEIRDSSTARTALGAALTGQVVLASLHASTAATTPLRLMDLGIEPFMAAAAVRGVINQRLLRRLCRRCRTPYVPRRSILDDVRWPFDRPERLWGPRLLGCEACFGTGYKGRAVVAEVLKNSDEIRAAIVAGVEPAGIEALAIAGGMVPILHDALQLVRQGATSLEEVTRVLGES
jgi:type IV pilus assembly protein PilB